MKKYDNFCRSLANLEEGCQLEPPYSTVVLSGLVSLFQICFEQSWKAMKDILEQHGYAESATGSPRMVLRLAYQAGMISDEAAWLSALSDRNNVTHVYNEALALEIVAHCRTTYVPMLRTLKETLEQSCLPTL